MYNELKKKTKLASKRAVRVRAKIAKTSSLPRLSVFKSNMHLYAQIIDDQKGVTLASSSTNEKHKKNTPNGRKNKEAAAEVGRAIAQKAKSLQVVRVVFDRGSHKYHGNIAAIADAARSEGLEF